MVNRIPDDVIANIKNSNNIADIVGEYVQLRKQGRNYFGLCPFHGEKTSSFSVAPDKEIFHCFGCGAGGNVFNFIMEIEGVSFVEAAKILADKAGIPLEVTTSEASSKSNSNSDMHEAHELLRELYQHALMNTQQGEVALNYLYNRGFTDEMIRKFEIGYAFDSWTFTTDFLKKRGFELDRMLKAGIISKRERDFEYVDRFRNRIIFPLQDAGGKTVAFSGRSIVAEDNPKYLNSPESEIFNKSKILYNLKNARLSIRQKKYVVLFEGFADVISADAAGVDNGVATMGTAFTKEHLNIISRITENIVICYDSDKPGLNAASKTADLILEAGKNVKIAIMPDSLDPDEYIRKYGSEKFQREVIHGAHSYASFKLLLHRKGRNFANQDEVSEYLHLITQEMAKIPSEVEREVFLKPIAEEFNLSLSSLLSEVRSLSTQKASNFNNHKRRSEIQPQPIVINHNFMQTNAVTQAEESLLYYMMKSRETWEMVRSKLSENEFNDPKHILILGYLKNYYNEGNAPDFSLFFNRISGELLPPVITKIISIERNEDPTEAEIDDYILQVKKQPIMDKVKAIEVDMKEAERVKDFTNAGKLAMEIVELMKKRNEIGR